MEVCAGLATGQGDLACTAAGTEAVVGVGRATVFGSFFCFSASTSSFLENNEQVLNQTIN